MSDLIDFLRAQLDEDERDARAAYLPNFKWYVEDRAVQLAPIQDCDCGADAWLPANTKADAYHISRHDPARVLREVEAKRETIRLYEDTLETIEMLKSHGQKSDAHAVAAESYLNVIRRDAAVYADHPDYNEAWRP